jgi:hypothetical protein
MAEGLRLTDEQLDELRRTGAPIVVRIGTGSGVVVQDAEAYKRLVGLLDELDVIQSAEICAERWRAMQDGTDPGVGVEEFFDSIRRRLRDAG